MTMRRSLLVCSVLTLLAGCASAPRVRMPAPVSPQVAGISAATTRPDIAKLARVAIPTPSKRNDLWERMRASFKMDDCGAPPALARARRETRHPRVFEKHLRAATPMIDFVQTIAARYHVPAEFALLPWVESHFRAVRRSGNRPAGIWQIMPVTARAMGLPITHGYDGRLDRVAASDAVMRLLSHYHGLWGDWRLADMAYNTGQYRMSQLLRAHGRPAASPVIPQLPVGRTTRRHLTKLLAIACIIDQPQRFHVTLPVLPAQDRLRVVQLSTPLDTRQAARMAALPWSQWRELNAAYRRDRMPANVPLQMLLPSANAQQFQRKYANRDARATSSAAASSPSSTTSSDAAVASVYTVTSGDSLWSIARRHDLGVAQLRRWNHIDADDALHPGQVLLLSAPE